MNTEAAYTEATRAGPAFSGAGAGITGTGTTNTTNTWTTERIDQLRHFVTAGLKEKEGMIETLAREAAAGYRGAPGE